MGRKKKNNITEYNWSSYQKKIFDFIEHGQGHLVVEAVAGSGKSSTLVKCVDLIPKDKKILLVAFNKDIVKELEKKVKGFENVDVRTMHSLGLSMIKRNISGVSPIPDNFKYEAYVRNNINNISPIGNIYKLKDGEKYRYFNNIKKYIEFGRCYLCQTVEDLALIDERYGIEPLKDEKEVAINALEWGRNCLETIDYGDMVWLPTALNLKPLGHLYDFIMVDECQDMNKAERELILKCFKMGTRMISVGDTSQAIYSFSGANPEAFRELSKMPNTTSLPLSISYRCSKNIVDFAKKLVPSIESNDDGREGVVKYNVGLDEINDGDMILCRNNAPLIQIYSTFLKQGKKCHILGKDISSNLKSTIKWTKQDKLNIDCRKDGVFARLYSDLFDQRDALANRCGIDKESAMDSQQIQNLLDTIRTLEILAEGLTTTKELEQRIDEIFPKRDNKSGIILSTIHKAKGLEANNVYIACKSLMPSKSAKKQWEIEQEYNLMYVAYTRAKDTLGFIDEKMFDKFTSDKTKSNLRRLEILTNSLYKKSNKVDLTNYNNVLTLVKHTKDVKTTIPTSTTISIDSNNGNKINNFSDILRKRKKTRKIIKK
jgi:superfamily I DNA/RNA helicase